MPHIKCYESLQPKTFNSHLGNKQCTQNEFSTKDFFSKCDQIRTIDKVSELLLRLKPVSQSTRVWLLLTNKGTIKLQNNSKSVHPKRQQHVQGQ